MQIQIKRDDIISYLLLKINPGFHLIIEVIGLRWTKSTTDDSCTDEDYECSTHSKPDNSGNQVHTRTRHLQISKIWKPQLEKSEEVRESEGESWGNGIEKKKRKRNRDMDGGEWKGIGENSEERWKGKKTVGCFGHWNRCRGGSMKGDWKWEIFLSNGWRRLVSEMAAKSLKGWKRKIDFWWDSSSQRANVRWQSPNTNRISSSLSLGFSVGFVFLLIAFSVLATFG